MSKIIKHVVSRRGFLRGTAVGSLGLAAAAVIGCGEDEAAAPASSGGAKPAVTPAKPVTPPFGSDRPSRPGFLNQKRRKLHQQQRRQSLK